MPSTSAIFFPSYILTTKSEKLHFPSFKHSSITSLVASIHFNFFYTFDKLIMQEMPQRLQIFFFLISEYFKVTFFFFLLVVGEAYFQGRILIGSLVYLPHSTEPPCNSCKLFPLISSIAAPSATLQKMHTVSPSLFLNPTPFLEIPHKQRPHTPRSWLLSVLCLSERYMCECVRPLPEPFPILSGSVVHYLRQVVLL